jgi:hypothetical protein
MQMKAIAITLLLTALDMTANGQPGPTPGLQPIRPVFEQSDLVCICHVETVLIERDEPIGKIDRDTFVQQHVVANLRPFGVFKSNRTSAPYIVIRYAEDVQAISPRGTRLRKNENGLFFLRSTSGASYEFSNRWMGFIPYTELPEASRVPGLPGLQLWLAGILEKANPQDRLNTLRLLEGFDELSDETKARVALQTVSSDLEIAFTSWAILLKNHSTGSLVSFLKYIEGRHNDTNPSLALIGVEEGLAGFREPQALVPIELLSDCPLLQIRRGAMRALRGMADPKSALTLIKHLDDANREIQYQSVITLNEIFGKNGDYGPSMILFDKNPEKYIALWKKWWDVEGHNLLPENSYSYPRPS